MAKRKGISKTTRFEVFKRDKFACQYCGKQAPDVVLVVDHIHPVSKGGENILLNYITACDTCNAGKGARTLADDSIVAKQRAEVQRLAERREQVSMMIEWHKALAGEREMELTALVDHWREIAAPYSISTAGMDEARRWLRKFSLHDLMSATEIAATQYFRRNDDQSLSKESVNTAWCKVPGIARISKLPPAERDLYYVRGILRRRFDNIDERQAIELLTAALDQGIDTEFLKQHAKTVRSWGQWRDDMSRWLTEEGGNARA